MATKRAVWVFLCNVVLLAFGLELGGQLYYFYRVGRPFFIDETPDTSPLAVAFGGEAWRPKFHPYFGYVIVPTSGAREAQELYVNVDGFLSFAPYRKSHPGCCEYPKHRSVPNELLIGVFGGSVAGGFAVTDQVTQGFTDALRAALGRDVTIDVLNFAVGAYKQPQQLLILNYFLARGQDFDAVINLDGFNEVIYSRPAANGGLDPTYPTEKQWLRLARTISRGAADTSLITRLYRENQSQRWHYYASRCAIASCYAFAELVSAVYAPAATPSESGALPSDFFLVPADGNGGTEEIALLWVRSSIAMSDLLRSRGIPYVHLLQPNQYLRAGKQFIPRDPSNETLRSPIEDGYAALRANAQRLRDAGVSFQDMTAIFDGSEMDVYQDDCCHFTPKGYALIYDRVAKSLAPALAKRLDDRER